MSLKQSSLHKVEVKMRIRAKPKRGDVFLADCGRAVGSEQKGIRPVVVIQNNVGNNHSPTTIVAMITAKEKKSLPVHVSVSNSGFRKKSCVLLEQIRTISVSRLVKYVCTLNNTEMQRIDEALKISLNLR